MVRSLTCSPLIRCLLPDPTAASWDQLSDTQKKRGKPALAISALRSACALDISYRLKLAGLLFETGDYSASFAESNAEWKHSCSAASALCAGQAQRRLNDHQLADLWLTIALGQKCTKREEALALNLRASSRESLGQIYSALLDTVRADEIASAWFGVRARLEQKLEEASTRALIVLTPSFRDFAIRCTAAI